MKNKNLFQKIVLIAIAVAVVVTLVAPAIFSQTSAAPKQEKLLNGLKVLMWPDAKADKVSVRIRVHSGSAFDPQGKEGVMQLLADNIFPNQASREYFTEDLSGSLDIIANYDYIEINASSKPDGFLSMLETVSSAVSNPAIDKDLTVKLRATLATQLAEREMDPVYVADRAVAARLFGTFPYGRPRDGTTDSVQSIDFADLIDAKERFLTADNATVAISGNFDRALGFRAIRRYFGSWLKSDKKTPSTFRQPDPPPAAVQNIPSPRPETAAIRVALRGVARSDKDFTASKVFTLILENRLKAQVPAIFADQLFVRNEAHVLPGILTIGFAADKTDVGHSNGKIEVNDLLGKALSDTITDSEFQSAKRRIQDELAKTDAETLWLDADTFKLAGPDAAFRSAANVSLADVAAFAAKARKQPTVTVLVNTPPAK